MTQHDPPDLSGTPGAQTPANPLYPLVAVAGSQIAWTADPHGQFIEPQEAWTDYTGQPWAVHRGSGWLSAIHVDDRHRVMTLWQAAIATGLPYESRGRIWHAASQGHRYFVARAVPVADRDGRVHQWIGALTDVDEQARAEAAQREYGAMSAFTADIGLALVQRDPLPHVLGDCAAAIVLHLGAAFARIWTLDEEAQVLELQASAGLYSHIDGAHSRIPVGELKIGLIAAERKPHLTNEVIGDPRIPEQAWATRLGLVAFAGYPLLVDERLVGVMAMFSRHPLSTTALDALASVANSVAVGIERKRAEERVADQIRMLQTLNRVGAAVASELDREKLVHIVTDAGTELTAAASGWFDPAFRGEQTARVADTGRPGERSLLRVSVKGRDGAVMGGLFFGHPKAGAFTEQHERLAVGIASWTSVALENAHLYERAQEVSRAKDEFLAVLSHELRTPLNAILGWSRMLRDGHVAAARVQHAVAVIERNARLQTQLVEDLLDVSRIISGKLRLDMRAIDLSTIVRSALDAVRPATSNKNITVRAVVQAGVGIVNGDPDRIEQVVWNLLANAVKFTDAGGEIQIELREAAGTAEIIVCDTGLGIAAEFLPHIFDRFRQADAGTSRKHGGLGLGLALVRALTEAHGGTVEAASPGLGQGATFTVRLPLQSVADAPTRPPVPAARPQPISGLRALVVDDDADARELLAITLTSAGAEALVAGSVREALRLLEKERPDLLLTDLGMPEQDGLDLIRIVRALPAESGGRIPAIAVTAYASSAEKQLALSTGFDSHVSKPYDAETLIAVIAALTSHMR